MMGASTEHALVHGLSKFERTWSTVLESCQSTLGQDDYEIIINAKDAATVTTTVLGLANQHVGAPTERLLHTVELYIGHLQNFASVIFSGLGIDNLDASCIWGSTSLLIEVRQRVRKVSYTPLHDGFARYADGACRRLTRQFQLAIPCEQALAEIAGIWIELYHTLSLFDIYRQSIKLDVQLLEPFFDSLVDWVLETVAIIKHFRKNELQTAVTIAAWNRVKNRLNQIIRTTISRTEHLQKLVEAESRRTQAQLAHSLRLLNNDGVMPARPGTQISTTVNTLPFQQNPEFYGRASILHEIDQCLSPSQRIPGVRSVAIWGTGGIGKSQIALEYAHRQWLKGQTVILWIATETDAEIAKSFNKAAKTLNLPSYRDTNTPNQNRFAVLQWLQNNVGMPWLVVLDNVVNHHKLIENWPTTGFGSILITCQSEILAASPATNSIEVPAFTIEEGSRLILKILNKSTAVHGEVSAARNLSEKLGGLALFIDIVAKQIKTLKKFRTIGEFLPYYDENYRTLHRRPRFGILNWYYSKDGDTVWQTAFDNLGGCAARLLSLLCFMAPEAIPQWILEQKGLPLPSEWEFLAKPHEYAETQSELLNLSLIRMNEETGLIYIHRLTQAAYFERMNCTDRARTFEVALLILCKAFPGRTGHIHLYKRWQDCEQLRQHVLAFQAQSRKLTKENSHEQDEKFIGLICDAAWYLLEIQSFSSCEETLTMLEKTIEDKTSLAYAYICTNFVSLFERTGRSILAISRAKTALQIRRDKRTDKNNLANGISDVGYARIAAFDAVAGLKDLEEALRIAEETPEPDRHKIYNVDRFLRNHGRGNMLLSRYDEAFKDFDKAEHYQKLIHGPNSHYDGEVMHERAKIARIHLGDLDLAYKLNERAYALMSPGKPTHSSVMATRYQQGCVCMARSQLKRDLKHSPTNDPDTTAPFPAPARTIPYSTLVNHNKSEISPAESPEQEALRHFRAALTICQLNEGHRGNQGESARVKWRLAQLLERSADERDQEEARKLAAEAEDTKRDLLATGDYPVGRTEEEEWDGLSGLLYR